MASLTAKQEKFVQEYLLDLNATKAAIRAGYSENSAKEIGCENLTKPNIAKRIQEYQKEQKEKFSVSFEEKQRLLLQIAEYGLKEEVKHQKDDREFDEIELKQVNPSAAVSAIKELNLMDGDHAPIKNLNKDLDSTDDFESFALRRGQSKDAS